MANQFIKGLSSLSLPVQSTDALAIQRDASSASQIAISDFLAKNPLLTTNGIVITSGGDGTLSITAPGTGILAALGVNVGSAGAPVLFNGAGGTPSSLTLTNGTGLPLTTGVTGTLPYGNGGTGATSLTNHGVVVAGASALSTVAPGSSGNILTSNGTDWTSATPATSGTVTTVGWTGGIVSIANPTSTPAFTIAGTSGGVPYFSGATTWASSGALTASQLVLGGGAGAAPTVLAAGSQYIPLTMGASAPGYTALALDQTVATSGILPSSRGGTGNGFTKISGPTAAERTKTMRDASDTVLELGGSYTPSGTWTSLTMVTPVLGTPTSGNLANCTFPTLNQNTSGSAASLSVSGQSGLMTVTGLASTNRAKTVRDAADTILELGGSYTPTGTWTSLTMVTPVLGTPTSGNLSNCTALPASSITAGILAATITFGENTELLFDAALSADGKYDGLTKGGTAGETLAFGDVCYFKASDSKWWLAKADAASTSGDVWVGACVLAGAANAATTMLLVGEIRADAKFPTFTVSAPVHISSATGGACVVAAPTGTDSVTRRLGFATTTDAFFFNASNDYYTHT